VSDATKAVFLSYASPAVAQPLWRGKQDAEAARRICEDLRTAGVEVWFDQSELRGGDAWDQKIRKQIKECSLFVPIISANTQERLEGYFRLEWRLADQRSHLMAKGKAFLLPLVIDAIRDSEAHVPDSFLEVQWTRLPNGETGEAFGARVQALLRRSAVNLTATDANPAPDAGAGGRSANGAAAPAGPHRRRWVGAAVGMAAILPCAQSGCSAARPLFKP